MQVPGSTSLRPLGVGEILDRAVTLCVKFFAPLSTIYLVYAIPLAIITYFSSSSLNRMVLMLSDASHAHGTPNAQDISRALSSGSPYDSLWTILAGIAALFIAPLPTGALIESITAFYLGRTCTFRQAYRVALDRYANMLGLTLLFVLTFGGLYFIVIVAIVFLVFVVALVAAAAKTVGVAIAIVLGIAFGLAGVALAIVLALAFQMGYYACVVERANFSTSYVRSLKRVFTSLGIRRSLLVGLVYFTIVVGIALVGLAGEAMIVGLLRLPVAGVIFETALRIATAAFTTAFVGIFYLDLRVREEGLDLQLQADGAHAAATLPG